MSEKIFALLLRLYPLRLREECGAEMRQLFRDRCIEERGIFARARLWLDVLVDLAMSIPGESEQPQEALADAPAFAAVSSESPSPGAMLSGALLAAISLAVFWIGFAHPGIRRDVGAVGPGLLQIVAAEPPADAERQRVIDAAIANLRKYYVDRQAADAIANALGAHARAGDYQRLPDDEAFAALVTRQMREISQDLHLELIYSQEPLPTQPRAPTAEDQARYRQNMLARNCMFEKIETLPHNVGYLKLDFFPDTSVCESTARAAMASLNHADALIFDLRDNRGGFPDMVALEAAYLFNHPVYFYNPRETTTEHSWTHSPVPGNLLADKPVYVLTSGATMSGAEQFCFNLKMLKRATLIGERTAGEAHAGSWHPIDDHFGMAIPEVKAINPYSNRDWEGTGVEPDVNVPAPDALDTATKLAASR